MRFLGASLVCPIFLGWPQRFIWAGQVAGGAGGGVLAPSVEGNPGGTPGNGGPIDTLATIPNSIPHSAQPVEIAKGNG